MNYRPVFLTYIVRKVMESIIRDTMVESLKNKFSCFQHGFMKHRSCLTNILESLEAWTKALDEGYGVDVIYLDYRKAFDSVSHVWLIEKLKILGISGELLDWISNFLHLRKMSVRVRNSFSDWVEVLRRVPQGSVLGLLLFLLFVNDLPSWIACNIRMFADDTKIWCIIKEIDDGLILQSVLGNLVKWSEKWLLKV